MAKRRGEDEFETIMREMGKQQEIMNRTKGARKESVAFQIRFIMSMMSLLIRSVFYLHNKMNEMMEEDTKTINEGIEAGIRDFSRQLGDGAISRMPASGEVVEASASVDNGKGELVALPTGRRSGTAG